LVLENPQLEAHALVDEPMTLPETTTPEALADHMGWSEGGRLEVGAAPVQYLPARRRRSDSDGQAF
jgi:hypothetical protein